MVPIFRLESDSESVGSAVLAGVGIIGDATGITDTQSMTMTGTIHGAERFITGIPFTEVEDGAAGFTTVPALGQERSTVTGRPLEDMSNLVVRAASARVPLPPELRPGLSTVTGRRLEDMPNPAVRAASARVPLAATDKADRPRAFRHAEAPASLAEARVAAEERVAAEASVAAEEGVAAE